VAAQKSDYHIRTVVIDPGHGGKDPGAVGKISKEKDLTLAISLRVGELITSNHPEVKVIYTRSTDEFVELYKRATIANEAQADLFISVHINAISGANAYGAETFAMGLHVSEENLRVAKLENSVVLQEENFEENYEGFDPSSPESHIIFSLYQNAYLEQSLKLAQKMQYYFHNEAGRYDRGVKQAGFLVLWRTSMPAILVECGFISNLAEEQFLNSSEGQEKIAHSIYNAFNDYKLSLEVQGKEIEINHTHEGSNTNKTIYPTKKTACDSIPSGIIYGVQLQSSKTLIPAGDSFFNNSEQIYVYKHNDLFKYFVGATNNYDDIVALHSSLKNTYSDCFIIAFKDGERIPVKQAQKEK
jgi:N-acetylmuramoyl-L-alanine amidase